MDREGKLLRIGAALLTCALALRLWAGGAFQPIARLFTSRTLAAVTLFLETGHVLRPVELSAAPPPETTAPTLPTQPTPHTEATETTQPPPEKPAFDSGDADLVQVHSYCGYEADVPAMLEQPLQWDLQQTGPTVLILHSHATESYENTENYNATSYYRTTDESYNMVSVGDALVQQLEIRGIGSLHDRQLHDYPSYSDAYDNARTSIREYLDQYPTIQLVLDLHRDAATDEEGRQIGYTVGNAAQLMLVVGTDAGGLEHGSWPENMSLAVKFHATLERLCPGICRPISFRSQRFNQDLSTGALLVEVGSAGNTRQEALAAVEILAEAIATLSQGTQ